MTFETILKDLQVLLGNSGHELGVLDTSRQGDGYNKEYLSNAVLLYKNPVLQKELELVTVSLVNGMAECTNFDDVKACRMAIKALLGFYDRLKVLHDTALEEKEKDDELQKGRADETDRQGEPNPLSDEPVTLF